MIIIQHLILNVIKKSWKIWSMKNMIFVYQLWPTLCDLVTPSLQWYHNECHGISNHWRLHCLLNCLFRRRSKKTSKLCITGLCEGNSLVTDEVPAKRPVTQKMFPFDDAFMIWYLWAGPTLALMMACYLSSVKPLPTPMLTYCKQEHQAQTSVKL